MEHTYTNWVYHAEGSIEVSSEGKDKNLAADQGVAKNEMHVDDKKHGLEDKGVDANNSVQEELIAGATKSLQSPHVADMKNTQMYLLRRQYLN